MTKIPDAQGYDILIWQRTKKSPTWCCGYTVQGEKFLKKLNPEYIIGYAMELTVFPLEFTRALPRHLRVGGLSPKTKKVHLINGDPLH